MRLCLLAQLQIPAHATQCFTPGCCESTSTHAPAHACSRGQQAAWSWAPRVGAYSCSTLPATRWVSMQADISFSCLVGFSVWGGSLWVLSPKGAHSPLLARVRGERAVGTAVWPCLHEVRAGPCGCAICMCGVCPAFWGGVRGSRVRVAQARPRNVLLVPLSSHMSSSRPTSSQVHVHFMSLPGF